MQPRSRASPPSRPDLCHDTNRGLGQREGGRQRRRWAAIAAGLCQGPRSQQQPAHNALNAGTTPKETPASHTADQVASSKPGAGSGALEPLSWFCRASQAARACCSPATTSLDASLAPLEPPKPILRGLPAENDQQLSGEAWEVQNCSIGAARCLHASARLPALALSQINAAFTEHSAQPIVSAWQRCRRPVRRARAVLPPVPCVGAV